MYTWKHLAVVAMNEPGCMEKFYRHNHLCVFLSGITCMDKVGNVQMFYFN